VIPALSSSCKSTTLSLIQSSTTRFLQSSLFATLVLSRFGEASNFDLNHLILRTLSPEASCLFVPLRTPLDQLLEKPTVCILTAT